MSSSPTKRKRDDDDDNRETAGELTTQPAKEHKSLMTREQEMASIWELIGDLFGEEVVKTLMAKESDLKLDYSKLGAADKPLWERDMTAFVQPLWKEGLFGTHKKINGEFFKLVFDNKQLPPILQLFPRERLKQDHDQKEVVGSFGGKGSVVRRVSNGLELAADFILSFVSQRLFEEEQQRIVSNFVKSMEFHVVQTLHYEALICLQQMWRQLSFYQALSKKKETRFVLDKKGKFMRDMLMECAMREIVPDTVLVSDKTLLASVPRGLRVIEVGAFRLTDGSLQNPLHRPCIVSEWYEMPVFTQQRTDTETRVTRLLYLEACRDAKYRDISLYDAEKKANVVIHFKDALEVSGLYMEQKLTGLGHALLLAIIKSGKPEFECADETSPNAWDLVSSTSKEFQQFFLDSMKELKEETYKKLFGNKEPKEALGSISLETNAFFTICFEHNLPVPLNVVLCRPMICWQAADVLMFRGDGQTAKLMVGETSITFSECEDKTKVLASGTLARRFVVSRPEDIVLSPAAHIVKYLSGAGTSCWIPSRQAQDEYVQNPRTRDMFACVVPVDWKHTSAVLNMSAEEPEFPTASIYSSFWKWIPVCKTKSSPDLDDINLHSSDQLRSFVTCQTGAHKRYDPTNLDAGFSVQESGESELESLSWPELVARGQ